MMMTGLERMMVVAALNAQAKTLRRQAASRGYVGPENAQHRANLRARAAEHENLARRLATSSNPGPGKHAAQPSALAMNPRNREASAARRARLLAAFDALPADTRADLIEAAETTAFTGYRDRETDDIRGIFGQLFALAGLE